MMIAAADTGNGRITERTTWQHKFTVRPTNSSSFYVTATGYVRETSRPFFFLSKTDKR